MKNYLEKINPTLKEYYEILSPEIPDFLADYINTEAMQKQNGISVTCGTYYSDMYDQVWYSSLDHSIAVALIIWNFTKDKKQTLSGLFHDIATPVFKHCIDFMNKDYEKQESTEELTTKLIKDSKEIMDLLKRDGIKIEEINDYHIYPIADNDTPMLSSDRLEYTLSNGYGVTEKLWGLDDIKEVYQDIVILKNEEGIDELGFKSMEKAEKFVQTMSKLSRLYRRNKTKFTMQFLADTMKKMSKAGLVTVDDLYKYSEAEVMKMIEDCSLENVSECFKSWKTAKQINESDNKPEDVFFVSIDNVKVRYINPLVLVDGKAKRIMDVSDVAKDAIEIAREYKTKKYAYLDFKY